MHTWKVRSVTFQQTRVGLNLQTPHHAWATLTLHPPLSSPAPHKQSINMLFQVMMGKSIWEFSPPRSTPSLLTPLLLLHFSECLKGQVVRVESIFKDCAGRDWMRRLMKQDKHKKNVQHGRLVDAVSLLFLTNLARHKKGFQDWPWFID